MENPRSHLPCVENPSRQQVDRLSDLPDDLLIHILSLMPTHDAVRSSALSRRWRYLWTHSPCIDLDQGYMENNRSILHPLTECIFPILLRKSCSSVRIFRLLVYHCNMFQDSELNECIDFCMRKGVQEMYLDVALYCRSICPNTFNYENDLLHGRCYELPMSFFRYSALRVLFLKDCKLNLPSAISFGSLETLHLDRTDVAQGKVQALISGCPQLKSFVLKNCWILGSLHVSCARLESMTLKCCHPLGLVKIDAPGLRHFKFKGVLDDQFPFCIENSPDLIDAKVSFCYVHDSLTQMVRFKNFIGSFACAKFLHLSSYAFEYLIIAENPLESPSLSLHKLKRVEIKTTLIDDEDVVKIANLLKISPLLEALSLSLTSYDTPGIDPHQFPSVPLELRNASIYCLQHNLKEIRIKKFQGNLIDATLAKFLLNNALVLEKVYVESREATFSHHLLMREYLLACRANLLAQLLYS